MLELLLCASITILPDFLYRRFVQGKRVGHEITLYTVWYELRWGITACLLLTVSLITLIFYFHPSTKNVTAIFRSVTILPETNGRVAEVFVGVNERVKAGQLLFRLDDSSQRAALETAQRRVAEIDAEILVAQAELGSAEATILEQTANLQQAQDELNTKTALRQQHAPSVSERELERLAVSRNAAEGALRGAEAQKTILETKISSLLPSLKASAQASVDQANVEMGKTVVRAGVDGIVQQFALRPGDIVNPLLRPAGILIPEEAGRISLVAGFGQIEANVLKVGMIAEATCAAMPFTIIPMVVTQVQDVIAAGQLRASDQLIELEATAQPGSIAAFLEPLYQDQVHGLPPGSQCIANAYTNNHDALEAEPPWSPNWIYLHVIDTVGLVHAIILRMQAAVLPVQSLVLKGGH